MIAPLEQQPPQNPPRNERTIVTQMQEVLESERERGDIKPDEVKRINELLGYLNKPEAQADLDQLVKLDKALGLKLTESMLSDEDKAAFAQNHRASLRSALLQDLKFPVDPEQPNGPSKPVTPEQRVRFMIHLIEQAGKDKSVQPPTAAEKIDAMHVLLNKSRDKEDPVPAMTAFINKVIKVKEAAADAIAANPENIAAQDAAKHTLVELTGSNEAKAFIAELETKPKGFFRQAFTQEGALRVVSAYINGIGQQGNNLEELRGDAKYLRGEQELTALHKRRNVAAVAFVDAQLKAGISKDDAFNNLVEFSSAVVEPVYQKHKGEMGQYYDIRSAYAQRYASEPRISLEAAREATETLIVELTKATETKQFKRKPAEAPKKIEGWDAAFSTFNGDNEITPSEGPRVAARLLNPDFTMF